MENLARPRFHYNFGKFRNTFGQENRIRRRCFQDFILEADVAHQNRIIAFRNKGQESPTVGFSDSVAGTAKYRRTRQRNARSRVGDYDTLPVNPSGK